MLRFAFWGCATVILYLALAPAPPITVADWDKLNHVAAFATLGVLGLPAWPKHSARVLAGLLAYGGLIEVLQAFSATRQGEWQDVVADTVGVLVAVAVRAIVRRWLV